MLWEDARRNAGLWTIWDALSYRVG